MSFSIYLFDENDKILLDASQTVLNNELRDLYNIYGVNSKHWDFRFNVTDHRVKKSEFTYTFSNSVSSGIHPLAHDSYYTLSEYSQPVILDMENGVTFTSSENPCAEIALSEPERVSYHRQQTEFDYNEYNRRLEQSERDRREEERRRNNPTFFERIRRRFR